MKTFSINILVYGKWEAYRKEVELSEEMPRDHIHTALAEMYIYKNNFEHIKDVEVVVEEYVPAEDPEGNKLGFEELEKRSYSWGDSDYETFSDFHSSILSRKKFPL